MSPSPSCIWDSTEPVGGYGYLQLLGLVVARDLLADAGYGEECGGRPSNRERTGVVLGVAGGQKLITPLTARLQYPIWERVLRSHGIPEETVAAIVDGIKLAYPEWNENAFPGLLGNVIAGRIANRFDLGGLNSVIDAACASSLSALKMSVGLLAEGSADMMITGGVDTDNSPFTFICFSKTPAFSQGDVPRPFDAGADGMMVGEGIGMVLLKRLEDAERDGDKVYAVIRGIGASSDGRFKSIYAPRPEGQALATQRAYEQAGIPPTSVKLVEAHGTGTKAGDPAGVLRPGASIWACERYGTDHCHWEREVADWPYESGCRRCRVDEGRSGTAPQDPTPTNSVEKPNPASGGSKRPLSHQHREPPLDPTPVKDRDGPVSAPSGSVGRTSTWFWRSTGQTMRAPIVFILSHSPSSCTPERR